MSSADKVLSVVALFTAARPVWSPAGAARRIGVSPATAYRYFNALMARGLLERIERSRYTLGPAIIELDRQIRLGDPVLKTAVPAMRALLRHCSGPATILLCRLYRERVMCIHAESNRTVSVSSYERGRPRPLLRGATSRIILANLPQRALADLWRARGKEIAAAGLGSSLEAFRATLNTMRQDGICVGRGEVDAGRIGIAAPVFGRDGEIVGSLSVVAAAAQTGPRMVARLSSLLAAEACKLVWTIRPDAVPARETAGRGSRP